MEQLKIAGFPQEIVEMLTAWLIDRWAYVEVGDNCSGYFRVKNRTVLGSCLGPVLFNLFISPLLKTSSDPAYADDSYYITTGMTKDVALWEMQEKINNNILLLYCKIGDFKIAGCVCLQKKVCLPSLLQGIFW